MICLTGWLPQQHEPQRQTAPIHITVNYDEPTDDDCEFDCDVDLFADDTDFDTFDHGLG